jgi:hypothetical protein
MIKLDSSDVRWLLPRLGVILLVILACYIVIASGMKMFNKSLGLSGEDSGQEQTQTETTEPQEFYEPEQRVTLPEAEELPEGPEASWELTPCSLWVSASSDPVVDSLPEAPEIVQKPLEAMFLIRRWARETGVSDDQLEMVYVFTNMDTIYVDLPVERDLEGLIMTIENRFICFTRLFPLVAGNMMSSYPDGIALRGIEGVFRR